ncbi:hypothetical protein BTM25_53810 [Actinomadura rubteroloni]|uniref:Uncharacterized protein n=1 Tax=Actinomadura rubteroloni TaxID=1926885 RepID=A0A2P4UBK9_9ACTN|nr:hypothetical protein [Actinomadura rubteroloni]POM22431.1 hypothetical protein BTM25_53810 [Actinomadura rubteroloni]
MPGEITATVPRRPEAREAETGRRPLRRARAAADRPEAGRAHRADRAPAAVPAPAPQGDPWGIGFG